MNEREFEKIKEEFITSGTKRKIEMYITLRGLNQSQYKELLRAFPYNEIHKLEAAMG